MGILLITDGMRKARMGVSDCIRRMGGMVLVVMLVASMVMPCLAFAADDDLGSVDEPAAGASDAGGQQTTNGVTVSSEGDSALIGGCSFGISDFYRAQAGSNKAIGDRYWGYNYYIGTEPDNLAVVSTGAYAVVYVPKATQEAFGFLYDSHNAQDYLKRYFIALDDVNAKGSSRLANVSKWYFTQEQSYEVDGVVFNFDQELDEGRYYAYVIGTDGSDVTSKANSDRIKLEFADFARAVPPSDVNIVQATTGLAWLGNFLATMDYSPLWVTLRTTLVAIIFIFVLGLAAAYFTMRISPRAQSIFDAIFTIPMVLPPTVCGFLLLLAFGRSTPVGQWFDRRRFPARLQLAGDGDCRGRRGVPAHVPQLARRLREPRPQHARCGAHARLVQPAHLLQAHAAARVVLHCGGHGARLCTCARRVRRDAVPRGQLRRRHAHHPHRHLLRVDERQHRHRHLLDHRHHHLQLHRHHVHQPVVEQDDQVSPQAVP